MIKRKINTIIKNIQNKFNSRKTSKLIEEDLDKDNINNEELGEFEPMYK